MRLENNQQLYDYLVSIGAKLNTRGEAELGRVVMAASRHAATVPSTEFLGESRIALRRVKNEQTVLTGDEQSGLKDIMRQLDDALDRR
jgi:hypothetical protein